MSSARLGSNRDQWGKTIIKFQLALRCKLSIFPIQWQCRFRTLASKVCFVCLFILFMFYLHLMINKFPRKWVEFQLIVQ